MFISEKVVHRLEVDFSKLENQVTGVIELAKLPENFVIQKIYAQKVGTLTSTGAATVLAGNATDPDGYVAADIRAQTDKNVVAGKGALLYEATDKYFMSHALLIADVAVNVTVAVAAITAGKIQLYVEGFCATQH